VIPTRQWLQLVSLIVLSVAVAWNAVICLLFLPRLDTGRHAQFFHAWVRLSHLASSYGWVAVALAVLVWSFWARHGYELQKKEWVARLLLIGLLLAGILAAPLPFIPRKLAARIPAVVLGPLKEYPALAPVLAWGAIILVLGSLSMDEETREALLGQGRVLGWISLVSLLFVLALTTFGWSATLP
jgi:RsiW-degrading membrane proteinase PrsW (M82 family)